MGRQNLTDAERHDLRFAARTELEQYQECQRTIIMLARRVAQLDDELDQLQGVSYDRDNVQTQPSPGALQAAIIDEKQECYRQMEDLTKRAIRIRFIIRERVEEPVLCRLLTKHYIYGQTLNAIAQEEGYGCRHLYRMHNRALEIFGENMSPDVT